MSNPSERVDAGVLRDWGLPAPGRSKQSRGDAVIVGASRRTPGAVILAFEAALRVGAGRVAVLVPGSVEEQLGAHLPEAAVHSLPDDPEDPIEGAAAEALSGADAVLVGPGFDDIPQTRATLDAVLDRHPRRLVLDAYALAVLPDLDRDRLPRELVLTPNEDELEMLAGAPIGDRELSSVILEVSRRFDATIASYGVASGPSGAVTRIDADGSSLGTAGSGDVLAGAITGFLARGVEPERAAAWGLWTHARSGERLSATHGLGFLARELATELAFAVHEVTEPR